MVGTPEEDTNRLHCPIDGCVYAITGDKHFKRKLFLTQHIANKHSEKRFSCQKCHKKYAIEWQLKYHEKCCGVEWKCGTCGKSYVERLSLVMHCKRHSHQLSPNNCIKKLSKSSEPSKTTAPIPIQFIVLPVFVDSNQSHPRLINILPKGSDTNTDPMSKGVSDLSPRVAVEECMKCKTKSPVKAVTESGVKKYKSIEIQTDRLSQKSSSKANRESRSTECQTIRKRNRKPQSNNGFESTETQTHESVLDSNKKVSNRIQISTSTSTTPPKRSKRNMALDINNFAINRVKAKSCAFTQTTETSATSSTTTSLDLFDFNSMLSQMNTNNAILEQSVQTEANDMLFSNEFNNIETQTVNVDLNGDGLAHFDTNEDLDLFKDFEFTDIETQTIWNNDRTTQTDEHLDQINDVILRYLDEESCAPHMSAATLFTSTQTQTQTDIQSLDSSTSTQISRYT